MPRRESSATIFRAPFNLQEVGHTNGGFSHTAPSRLQCSVQGGLKYKPFASQEEKSWCLHWLRTGRGQRRKKVVTCNGKG